MSDQVSAFETEDSAEGGLDGPSTSAGRAWADAIAVLQRAGNGDHDAARRALQDSADPSATGVALTRLLALLLPSVAPTELSRFIRTARTFDPLEG